MVNRLIGCAIALLSLGAGLLVHSRQPTTIAIQTRQTATIPTTAIDGNFDTQGIFHPLITKDRLGYPYLSDAKLSPGEVLPVGLDQICIHGYSKTVRHTTGEMKHQVYEEYGVQSHQRGEMEVDHLVNLSLGGADTLANLWAQPADVNLGGYSAGFKEKDALELVLLRKVCDRSLDLQTAQRAIATDWIRAYGKYIGNLPEYPTHRGSSWAD